VAKAHSYECLWEQRRFPVLGVFTFTTLKPKSLTGITEPSMYRRKRLAILKQQQQISGIL